MARTKTICGIGLFTFALFGCAAPSWGQGYAAAGDSYVTASDRDAAAVDLILAQQTGEAAPPAPATRQPPAPATTAQSNFLAGLYGRTAASESSSRLAGTPNMFGDSESEGHGMMYSGPIGMGASTAPLAGGARRIKIAEDDNTLPQDRIFFLFNHFQDSDSIIDSSTTPPVDMYKSMDRYTIGFEKTFGSGGCWSYELRMPFAGGFGYASDNFASEAGKIGNLAVVLKKLVVETDTTALGIGIAVDTPTGSDAKGSGGNVEYTINNQAAHLMPYVGAIWQPGEKVFFQGFVQADVATNGNRVDYYDPLVGIGSFGNVYDQTLLYADLGIGYWLVRNPCANVVTGLAGIMELHYTSTLNGASILQGTTSNNYFAFGNFADRQDIVDLTVGVHAELAGHTIVRAAGVIPLRDGDNRLFNSEVQVQLERRC